MRFRSGVRKRLWRRFLTRWYNPVASRRISSVRTHERRWPRQEGREKRERNIAGPNEETRRERERERKGWVEEEEENEEEEEGEEEEEEREGEKEGETRAYISHSTEKNARLLIQSRWTPVSAGKGTK